MGLELHSPLKWAGAEISGQFFEICSGSLPLWFFEDWRVNEQFLEEPQFWKEFKYKCGDCPSVLFHFWIMSPQLLSSLVFPNATLRLLTPNTLHIAAWFLATLYHRNYAVLSEQKFYKHKSYLVWYPSFKGLIPFWRLLICRSF